MSRTSILSQALYRVDGVLPHQKNAKHQKMALSPFIFYRGTSQLFYADIASGQLPIPQGALDMPLTTVMGDCHISNFGFFTEEGSHGDEVIFAINDFDDACIGHAWWDVQRYAVALLLCAEHGRGVVSGEYPSDAVIDPQTCVINPQQAIAAIHAFVSGYQSILTQSLLGESQTNKTFTDFNSAKVLKKAFKKAKKRALGGKDFARKSSLAKACDLNTFPLTFISEHPKFEVLDETVKADFIAHFAPYCFDKILDVVKRHDSGTGSVNMDRYYCLVGPDTGVKESALTQTHIVEIKQQRQAAPIYYFPDLDIQNTLDPAHLTVVCQRRMQRRPDLLIEDIEWQQTHWLMRTRHHAKVGIDPEDVVLGEDNVNGGYSAYAYACGAALALGHCRGDRRSLEFETHMAQVLALHSEELVRISTEYAQQVIEDWHWLCEQITAS